MPLGFKKIIVLLLPTVLLFIAATASAIIFYTLDWNKKNPVKHLAIAPIIFGDKIYEKGEKVTWNIGGRNYSTLPPGPGKYSIRVTLKDPFYGDKVTSQALLEVLHSKMLKIDGVQFNSEHFKNDKPIGLTFDVLGFTPANGAMNLTEDLLITDDAGGTFLEKPALLEVTDPWPGEDRVRLENSLDIPIPGTYHLKITLHDKNSGMDAVTESSLKVE